MSVDLPDVVVVLHFDPSNASQPFDYYLDLLEMSGIVFDIKESAGSPLALMYQDIAYGPASEETSGQDGISFIIEVLRGCQLRPPDYGAIAARKLEVNQRISDTMRIRHAEKKLAKIGPHAIAAPTDEDMWSLDLGTGEIVALPANT